MPLSGKLPTGSLYNGPYPRKGNLRLLRTVLLFCWAIIVLYASYAAWNVYFTENTTPKELSSFNGFLNALVLRTFIRDPNAPLGVSTTFLVLFACLLISCLWATRDWKRDQKAVQEQEIQQEVDVNIKGRGIDKQLPKPQGPPFDLESPSHPDEFIGRAEEIAWLLKRLQAGKTNGVTAVWGPAGRKNGIGCRSFTQITH